MTYRFVNIVRKSNKKSVFILTEIELRLNKSGLSSDIFPLVFY